ncbi:hypothetical protein [Amphritea balenae]|uniref:Uncharacterized protein n=1 Tax=Amphritea balenae TaxID=452629 RepID=A0A3P1STQ1_9GAMM|nr:hypothetical protein [Amphritea balenae]RRD00460.1 hypothetical protein EHS89_05040 [Amphritea balenae]GGK70580.1 hypothetical protein GCM10007941_21010 [Amphritea balenae]
MYKYLAIMVLTFCQLANASSETLNPFQLPYGEELSPYTDNRETNGLPIAVLGLDVPMPPTANLPMFYDYSLLYFADSGKIYSIQAKRAYATLIECQKDVEKIESVVQKNYVDMKMEYPGKFINDMVVIQLSCALRAESPIFHELGLYIFHREANENIKAGRR